MIISRRFLQSSVQSAGLGSFPAQLNFPPARYSPALSLVESAKTLCSDWLRSWCCYAISNSILFPAFFTQPGQGLVYVYANSAWFQAPHQQEEDSSNQGY